MSDPQRRELLAAAGMASLATLAGVQPAAAGDPSFMNNVPDPALADKELPTFKFALEKSVGKVIGNSYGKEATVTHQPSAPLQGWKLPPETHKYRLLAQPPHATYRGGREWRVDSSRFPIAKTITGVVLDLDPGALRTLHWHPNADEWQYVIEGEVSVTLFGSHGRFRTEQLQKGDVGYIPQGYGHSIENLGDKPARILIGCRPL